MTLGSGAKSAGFATAFGVLEAVAFAFRLQDVPPVRESIKRGTREAFAAEHFSPAFEGQVRGHDQAVPLIRGSDDVEQRFGPGVQEGRLLARAGGPRLAGGVAHLRVDEKTNEHKGALTLLTEIVLKETVVVVNAASCRRDWCEQILEGEGDSVLNDFNSWAE